MKRERRKLYISNLYKKKNTDIASHVRMYMNSSKNKFIITILY